MKKFLLLAVVLIVAISGSAFGAIVYSGSQNVTLTLQGGMSPPPEMAMISIAGYPDDWDDFIISLEYVELMDPMGTMAMGTRLTIGGGMGMGQVLVRSNVMATPLPALNFAAGAVIDSSYPVAESALLSEAIGGQTIIGEFGEEGGYIGLMIPGSAYYAWLSLSNMSNLGESDQSVTFDRWAYEDVAGNPIGAGAIPEPGTLLLGSIGIGLATWLRRRRAL